MSVANLVAAHSPDVVFLTETWLSTDIKDSELFLSNYSIYRSDRPERKPGISAHGGSLIAVHRAFTSTPGLITAEIPGAVAQCIISIGHHTVCICCVYNPPNDSPYRLSIQCLQEVIRNAISVTPTVIIAGDFNLPGIDWNAQHSDDEYESIFLNTLLDCNLNQWVDVDTRGSRTLDLVCTSSSIEHVDTHTLSTHMSDHLPIISSFELADKTTHMECTVARKLSYCRADYESLCALIVQRPFTCRCWSNPDVLVKEWYEWLMSIIQATVPLRTAHRSRLPPWITSSSSNLIKKLNTTRQHKGESHPATVALQSTVDKATEDDRRDYQEKLANSRCQTSWYRFFRKTRQNDYPSTMTLGTRSASTDADKASLFIDYFSSVFRVSSKCYILDMPHDSPSACINDFDCSRARVHQILKDLDVRKSGGLDGVPATLLKNSCHELSKSMSQLFYKIKQTCKFPRAWKSGVVSAIYKKGDRRLVSNYRPISLLNIPSKVLERCIFMDLYPFLETYLHRAQYGFRKRRSCITQLLVYLDAVYKALNRGDTCNVVYTDFEKAFDKVDHGILLRKLWTIGVRGRLWRLIRSYLSDRVQAVRVGESLSSFLPVTSGVPQGSLLGPLLFLVLINDLPDACSCGVLMCADDTKLLPTHPSLIQTEVSRLEDWCNQNNMHINAKKCSIVSFSRSVLEYQPNVVLDAARLPDVRDQLDLGLLVSSSLKWDNHIADKLSKAHKAFYAVRRNSGGLTALAKLNIYKTMILPIIVYASPCWFASTASLKKLESCQKKVLRWIVGDKPYEDCLRDANLLPISLYLQLIDLLFLSNVLDGRYYLDISLYIQLAVPSRNTRQADNPRFLLDRPRTRLCEHNFWFRAPDLANRLPPHVGFFRPVGLKARLLSLLWSHFQTRYNANDSESWRL